MVVTVAAAGCQSMRGPRPSAADSSFNPPVFGGPSGPRGVFDSGTAAARRRDHSRPVDTSPATEGRYTSRDERDDRWDRDDDRPRRGRDEDFNEPDDPRDRLASRADPRSPYTSPPFPGPEDRDENRNAGDRGREDVPGQNNELAEGGPGRSVPASPASQPRRREERAEDPFFDEDDPPPTPATSSREPAPNAAAKRYAEFRNRLERCGATFRKAEPDPTTGEFLFRCEVPNPQNPDLLRVFEASHPDELKAIEAVTDAAELWVAQNRPGGP